MRFIPLILMLAIAVSPAGATDFQKRFDEAAKSKNDVQVEQAVAAWTAAEPQNPQAYVAAANYYFAKARRVLIQATPKPPEKGDYALRDRRSGKIVGSVGPTVSADPVAASRAADMLQEATRKFPERLDIWFGLAYMYREFRNFDKLYATLEGAIKYCAAHPTGLKWKNGGPLPKDPANFMPEYAQAHIKYFFGNNNPEDEKRGFRLAKLLAETYPNHPYPVNVIGVYYATKKDWAQAATYLERAHELAPRDAIIMFNLGRIYTDMHDNAKARAYYEKVIASDAGEAIRQRARENLAKLK